MKGTFLLIVLFNIFLVSCQQIEKKSSAILEKEENTREMDRPAKIGITGSLWSSCSRLEKMIEELNF